MNDEDLELLLRKAFLPYACGFLTTPDRATLTFVIDATLVDALASIAGPDYDVLLTRPDIRMDLQRAFDNLVRFQPDSRGAVLAIASLDDPTLPQI